MQAFFSLPANLDNLAQTLEGEIRRTQKHCVTKHGTSFSRLFARPTIFSHTTTTGNPCGLTLLFFACPKKRSAVWSAPHRYERAAKQLRTPRSSSSETSGAKTRCAQTVCPFIRSRTLPPGPSRFHPCLRLVPANNFHNCAKCMHFARKNACILVHKWSLVKFHI